MNKLKFNWEEKGGLEIARTIVFERLRKDPTWKQFDASGTGFNQFVEYVGSPIHGRNKLTVLANDILWECIIQGIIFPGRERAGYDLPWFHITEYGHKVLETNEYLPHDPTGYLDQVKTKIPNCDDTVIAYLSESLNCFTRNNSVASVVMLGIASERAFLLLCEAFLDSIKSPTEKSKFKKIYDYRAIKPKMDWVSGKAEQLKSKFPEDTSVMLIGIFNFIRSQRNELGHPKEKPPKVSREDAFVYLRLFPKYYSKIIAITNYLSKSKI